MTDHDQKPPLERAVEGLVYAPIGLALFARDVLPPLFQQFVNRGRQEVEQVAERVNQQVSQARVIGQFAVNMGTQQVKREVNERLAGARAAGEDLARRSGRQESSEPTRHSTGADDGSTAGAPGAASSTNGSAPAPSGDASHLPIPDYDELSASQVVDRLAGLDAGALAAVREYESARRQRKTILTRIDQLSA
ncbi:MAG TPA: hypothetical protein VM618_09240 [Acidimicrobiia bacterium]|nr:hypothetical protein [Acidimicrobiia bacterium]